MTAPSSEALTVLLAERVCQCAHSLAALQTDKTGQKNSAAVKLAETQYAIAVRELGTHLKSRLAEGDKKAWEAFKDGVMVKATDMERAFLQPVMADVKAHATAELSNTGKSAPPKKFPYGLGVLTPPAYDRLKYWGLRVDEIELMMANSKNSSSTQSRPPQ